MNVSRFVAKTSREALRQVKEALGPDAVVLSNRTVEGGVEIVAMRAEEIAPLVTPSRAGPAGEAGDEAVRSASGAPAGDLRDPVSPPGGKGAFLAGAARGFGGGGGAAEGGRAGLRGAGTAFEGSFRAAAQEVAGGGGAAGGGAVSGGASGPGARVG